MVMMMMFKMSVGEFWCSFARRGMSPLGIHHRPNPTHMTMMKIRKDKYVADDLEKDDQNHDDHGDTPTC